MDETQLVQGESKPIPLPRAVLVALGNPMEAIVLMQIEIWLAEAGLELLSGNWLVPRYSDWSARTAMKPSQVNRALMSLKNKRIIAIEKRGEDKAVRLLRLLAKE